MRRQDRLCWDRAGCSLNVITKATLSVMTSHLFYTTSPFYPLSPLFSHACSSPNHLDPSLSPPLIPSLNMPWQIYHNHHTHFSCIPCHVLQPCWWWPSALPWSARWFREPLQQVPCLCLTPGQWGWRLSQDSLGTGWDRSVHSSYWAIGVPPLAAVPLCSFVFVRTSCLSRKPTLNQIISFTSRSLYVLSLSQRKPGHLIS